MKCPKCGNSDLKVACDSSGYVDEYYWVCDICKIQKNQINVNPSTGWEQLEEGK